MPAVGEEQRGSSFARNTERTLFGLVFSPFIIDHSNFKFIFSDYQVSGPYVTKSWNFNLEINHNSNGNENVSKQKIQCTMNGCARAQKNLCASLCGALEKKQQRKMTKFWLFWRTQTTTAIFLIFSFGIERWHV